MTTNLATWERGISVGTGAALLWLATRDSMSRTTGRTGLAATGAGLIARGVSGFCPVTAALKGRSATREALSGQKGIHVRESIMVARPVEAVYAAWRDLSNLPAFMDHVARVELLDDGRTHWVVRGPGGTTLEWDAEIINDIPTRAHRVALRRGRRRGERRVGALRACFTRKDGGSGAHAVCAADGPAWGLGLDAARRGSRAAGS